MTLLYYNNCSFQLCDDNHIMIIKGSGNLAKNSTFEYILAYVSLVKKLQNVMGERYIANSGLFKVYCTREQIQCAWH